jgi:nitrous oxide reductase accessory protein NosL
MDRRTYHRTRHLVLYSDGLIEGTCSIRCVAVSLMQRPYLPVRAFYAADFGSNADPRPLVDTDQATYIIGGDFPPVMSRRPKTAFADAREAQAQKEARGGDIASFVEALKEAYADMVDEMQARRRRPRQAG